MNNYEIIYESLCNAVNDGEISLQFAEEVNQLAYDKYVTESIFKMIADKFAKKKNDVKPVQNNTQDKATQMQNKMAEYNNRMNNVNKSFNNLNNVVNNKAAQFKTIQ